MPPRPRSRSQPPDSNSDRVNVVAVPQPEPAAGHLDDDAEQRRARAAADEANRHVLLAREHEDLGRARLGVDQPYLLDPDAGVERELVAALVVGRQHLDDELRSFETSLRSLIRP